jgi:hypothetical protein
VCGKRRKRVYVEWRDQYEQIRRGHGARCVGIAQRAERILGLGLASLIFGAREPKAGAVVSSQQALEHPALNHRVEVVEGILADESRDLLQRFFQARRASRASE